MEHQIYNSVGLLEFYLNELGHRFQFFVSKIFRSGESFQDQMQSLDPDVDAIKSHMEELSHDKQLN